MTRLTLSLLIAATTLAGCGRIGDSGLNPFGWGGGRTAGPATLEPDGGYNQPTDDLRPPVPQIIGADWQPIPEGRLLVLRGFAPVKGYHSAALVRTRAQGGRDGLEPDLDGVLRLRFVAVPPDPSDPAARLAANPATDTITVALPIGFARLARLNAVEIEGGDRILTLRR